MEGNPYSAIIESLRKDTNRQLPAFFRLGEVSSVSPLSVVVGGTAQHSDSLLKNDALTFFETGDRLLLVPIEDEQRYIILCRVVSA